MRLLAYFMAALLLAGHAFAAERTAIFAGGCFWCVESDFEGVDGVIEATSGYIGGSKSDATYKKVSGGRTQHYEAVAIRYDDTKISYKELVNRFFRSVDPTDSGGQFCDRGKSYRTAIFTTTKAEADIASQEKARAEADLGRKIVTPILKASTFYAAEAYHQDYYKSSKKVLTRFGYIPRSDAYKRYRKACGRDAQVQKLWGGDAWVLAGS